MVHAKLFLSLSRFIVGALVLSLICYGVGIISVPDKHWTLDRSIDSLIQTELPNGTQRSQVEKWLVSKGVAAFGYSSGEEQLEGESSVTRSKHKPSELSGVLQARLDTGHSLLSHNITYIVFFFDQKGGLIDRSTERGGIGL